MSAEDRFFPKRREKNLLRLGNSFLRLGKKFSSAWNKKSVDAFLNLK